MRTLAHIGVPTKQQPASATYLADAKLYVTDPSNSKHMFEFLYFEDGSPMPEIIKNNMHLAYMVDDLEAEIAGAEIIMPPFMPFENIKAAFILEEGMPIELMQVV